LAVEILRRRSDVCKLLAPLNCAETFAAVEREREILRGYGGGCHQKIGVSVLRRPFGEITFLRGLADNGEVLDNTSLHSSKTRPAKISREQMWPLTSAESDWFRRARISIKPVSDEAALWIAKAAALPDDWCPGAKQIVWTSGLQTWKGLATRGVWVHGSAESLGEQEPQKIETLAGRDLNWIKLTHAAGYDEGLLPLLPTYQLVPKAERPDLHGRKYFFWTSGSSFEYALSLNPWIKSMTHFCGPGNTQRILDSGGVQPHIFLDRAQWIREMSE
jgi:hydroxymethylbilane synthase